MKPTHLLPCLMIAACTAACANPEEGPATERCSVVFGQGRNAAEGDDQANQVWDQVNLAFNAEVAARLSAAGIPALPLVLRVTATDLQGNLDKVMARALAEHCDAIVETTVYADYATRTLVARLRDHPLIEEAGGLRVGPPRYAVERNFELNRTTLDRVRPAALAAEMSAELLQRGRRR